MRRLLFAVVGLTLAVGSSAFADEFNFYLTVPENGGFTLPPPDAVDVDVNLTSQGNATITFTVNNGLDGDTFQLDHVFFSPVGPYTVTSTSYTGPSVPGALTGSVSLDNLKNFATSSNTGTDTQVVFNLSDSTSSTPWTSAVSVLTGSTACNQADYGTGCSFLAAAQVKTFTGGVLQTQDGKSNLDIAGTGTVPGVIPSVPEPSSWILLATAALIGLVGVGRKKFSANRS